VERDVLERINWSEWAAPIVAASKSNGAVRICGDFEVIESAPSSWPTPSLPIFENLFLATILRQALTWLIQSCRVMTSKLKQNRTRKHESHVNDAWCDKDAIKICSKIWGAHLRRKTHPPTFVLAHQTDQIGIDAAAQRHVNNQNVQVICYRWKYYRSWCKVSLVRHHEVKRWSSVAISPQKQIR